MEDVVVPGMKWCQKCCAPMQMVACPHTKYFIVDPRDEIDPSIETVDRREQILEEMYLGLAYLVDIVLWGEDNETSILEQPAFKQAEMLMVKYWEWDNIIQEKDRSLAMAKRKDARRNVPK